MKHHTSRRTVTFGRSALAAILAIGVASVPADVVADAPGKASGDATPKPQQKEQPTGASGGGAPASGDPKPPATGAPEIAQDAMPLIDQVRSAYSSLKAVELAGTISTKIDAAQVKQDGQEKISSSFEAPNKFRLQLGEDLLVGSSGAKVYAHSKQANSYILADPADAKAPLQDMPSPIPEILRSRDPSLFLALRKDPLADLGAASVRVRKAKDVDIGGTAHPALEFRQDAGGPVVTMAVDPKTHLIRRYAVDLRPVLAARGATDAKSAEIVIDYSSTKADPQFKPDHFAWSPPEGASDAAKARADAQSGGQTNLAGKPAPAFKLDSLQGESVSLDQLKGNVVVLDFWASWCPPCVQALPHLGQLYAAQKDQGVKVFAVNLRQDADEVKAFVAEKNLDVPVLLDKDGQVAQKYGVSAIPQTVVIGKDGTVKRVFVGMGPDTNEQIAQLVDELKGNPSGGQGGAAVPASSKQPAAPGPGAPK